jgi:F-type H+-transporting ATPase subunit gamma
MADKASGAKSQIIVFGRKGTSHFSRLERAEMIGAYEDVADVPETNVFAPVIETIRDGMAEGDFKPVQVLYTKFNSSLSQTASQFQLLPITLDQSAEKTEDKIVYEFEPMVEAVLEEALRIYFEARLMAARIESAVSENAMRMIAMGNAHRNASDLADDLVLELNSVRQAAITQEIAEITGGAEALRI